MRANDSPIGLAEQALGLRGYADDRKGKEKAGHDEEVRSPQTVVGGWDGSLRWRGDSCALSGDRPSGAEDVARVMPGRTQQSGKHSRDADSRIGSALYDVEVAWRSAL